MMIAKRLRINRGDLQIPNGLSVKRTMDVGMRKDAKIVLTTSRFNTWLRTASTIPSSSPRVFPDRIEVMLDRIDVLELGSSPS